MTKGACQIFEKTKIAQRQCKFYNLKKVKMLPESLKLPNKDNQ
jgi:hypothetical protein